MHSFSQRTSLSTSGGGCGGSCTAAPDSTNTASPACRSASMEPADSA
ncbi:hypothetical protein ACN28S_37810 [Cystobacter fuscus]